MAYATEPDLVAYLGDTPPPDNAATLLERASELIDVLLIGAWYPTDDAGLPTCAEHITALSKATCAQVQWWDEQGDTSGLGLAGLYGSTSIGNVSLGRNAGAGSAGSGSDGVGRYSPTAVNYLRLAGLLPVWAWVVG